MKKWDYTSLVRSLEENDPGSLGSLPGDAASAIWEMQKEINRLQAFEYIRPSDVSSCGHYLMFRTDDDENTKGVPCVILQAPEGNFYLQTGDETIQDVLTLDEEVRFKKNGA